MASKRSNSASTIANNQDLLTQILIHLPIKSVVGFKSVSKHWLSLISNPQLFRYHRHPVPAAPSALFLHLPSLLNNPKFVFLPLNTTTTTNSSSTTTTDSPFQSLDFIPDPAGIRILQSCNGLLLCCSYQCEERSRNYYVYNPTTKLFATLPKPDGLFISTVLGIVLSFDPSASRDHYKAMRVRF